MAMAFETWVGPGYMSALAGELKIPVIWVTLLTALPWVGASGQILALSRIAQIQSLRRFCVKLAAAARLLWAIPIFAGWAAGLYCMNTGKPFPIEAWFTLTVVTASIASLVGSVSGIAWLSWMRRLIPSILHGRFFGVRQGFTMGSVMLANLIAAALLGYQTGGYRIGLAIIGALALTAAFFSTRWLSFVPDEPSVSPGVIDEVRKPNYTIAEMVALFKGEGRSFSKYMIFSACFQMAVTVAGPYFPYYFTHEVKISLSTFAFWSILTNLGAFVSARFWGRTLDRSDPHRVLWAGCLLISLSPLPYAFASFQAQYYIGPIEYFFNGVAWSAFQIAMLKILYREVPKATDTLFFSVYTALFGLGGALGTFGGGFLADQFLKLSGFQTLWWVASGIRLSVFLSAAYYFSVHSRIPAKLAS